MRIAAHLLTFVTFIILAAGCASRMTPSSGLAGAPAPPAAVERFLQLAAEREYVAMGWIFGTSEGAILERDPAPQVEQRMYALATLLEHDGFVLGNGAPVPGRTGNAIRFNVVISNGGERVTVPFTVVHGPADRWYVERIGVEAITDR